MKKRIKLSIIMIVFVTILLFAGYSIYTHPLSMRDLIGKELKYINTVTAVKINTGAVEAKRNGSPVSKSGTIKGKNLEKLKRIMSEKSYRRKIGTRFGLSRSTNADHYMFSLYMYHNNKLVDIFKLTDVGGLYHSNNKNGPFVYLYSSQCDQLVEEISEFMDQNVDMK